MTHPTPGADTAMHQYLTFQLGTEHYGVDILRVQEIKGWNGATALPNLPPHLKGVMNLRGTIVPVIDLRLRFGMPAVDAGPFTVVIVAAVERHVVGLLVDAVSDVLDVAAADLQPPPDLGRDIDVRVVHGIARTADGLVVLLDLEHVVDPGELDVSVCAASDPAVGQ